MSTRVLLISDLHLQQSRPDISRSLLHFLTTNKARCDALFILGDLFEVWIGDDEESDLSISIASALRDFQASGASIYIMHGNRDFLIGPDYASQCGATLIDDGYLLKSAEHEFLLCHGDTLCTDDEDYMRFRHMVRQASWQQEFLAKSLDERRAFAELARKQSQEATAGKEMSIMDVNQTEVLKTLAEAKQTTLIHGHTHRPAQHKITLDEAIDDRYEASRVVLGDWDKEVWFIEIIDGEINLEHFPLLQ